MLGSILSAIYAFIFWRALRFAAWSHKVTPRFMARELLPSHGFKSTLTAQEDTYQIGGDQGLYTFTISGPLTSQEPGEGRKRPAGRLAG